MRLIVPKWKLVNFWLFLVYYIALNVVFFLVLIYHSEFNQVIRKIGFEFNFSVQRNIISGVVFLVTSFALMISKQKEFIYSVLGLIFLIFLIPSGIVFSSSVFVNKNIFLYHIIFFYSIFLISKIRVTFIDISFDPQKAKKIILVIVILAFIPLLQYSKYVNWNNLLLKDIYETRAVFQKVSGTYLSYSYSLLNKFILPVLFIFLIHFRQRILAFGCFLLLIYLFLLGAHKSVLYGTMLSFILYRFSYQKMIRSIILIFIFTTIASLIAALYFDNLAIVNYSIRRAPMLPAILDLAYFDYFKTIKLFWTESRLNPFMESPLPAKHSYIIAEAYFNKPEMSSNNGIISDGYMNAGHIGLMVNILIVSIYFSLINQFRISSKFFPLMLLLIISIMSSSLTTIMLTHGAIIFIFIAFFLLRNTEDTLA